MYVCVWVGIDLLNEFQDKRFDFWDQSIKPPQVMAVWGFPAPEATQSL